MYVNGYNPTQRLTDAGRAVLDSRNTRLMQMALCLDIIFFFWLSSSLSWDAVLVGVGDHVPPRLSVLTSWCAVLVGVGDHVPPRLSVLISWGAVLVGVGDHVPPRLSVLISWGAVLVGVGDHVPPRLSVLILYHQVDAFASTSPSS